MPEPIDVVSNPLELLLGYQLRRATAAVMPDLIAKFEALGLRLSEGSALLLIDRNPGINQSAVGRALDIQRANMAPLVATLSKRRLIERRRMDGRSYGLHVTASGAGLAEKVAAISEDHDQRMAAALPPDLRGALPTALASLRRAWAGENA